ncbi:hypothetical protein C3Y87_09090 [Carbonactinospora thermoautotrophica]|uniref:PIN domain-containing protein n=2 Tax=Carbonactinospora thermoautotrophica TaxID=1469144 RepID=A0A132NB61_9ACTN|nr:hypothetical protein TH66_04350 [Carbonactinospora thermoautotrophica]KWX07324.1 hypothetical protein TR74_19130 [Carbonactinospora thermoautotrophica]MCX9191566.1 hypothetical protein [Carbonactinospora thermoautotrophica]
MTTRFRMVLDAGALTDIEAHPRGRTYVDCCEALFAGYRPLLPAVVYAQVWRNGPRQAPLARVRKICEIVPFTDQTAEDVGRLLALSGTSDVVDAAVVITAISHNAVVLTSDPEDIGKLADAVGVRLPLVVV